MRRLRPAEGAVLVLDQGKPVGVTGGMHIANGRGWVALGRRRKASRWIASSSCVDEGCALATEMVHLTHGRGRREGGRSRTPGGGPVADAGREAGGAGREAGRAKREQAGSAFAEATQEPAKDAALARQRSGRRPQCDILLRSGVSPESLFSSFESGGYRPPGPGSCASEAWIYKSLPAA